MNRLEISMLTTDDIRFYNCLNSHNSFRFTFRSIQTNVCEWRHGCTTSTVYVQPQYRGKGAGSRLYSFCVKKALDEECKFFDFIVLKWNKRAFDLYESFGACPRDNDAWRIMRMTPENMKEFMNENYLE